MKKISAILLAFLLIFSLAACGNNSSDNKTSSSSATTSPSDSSKSENESSDAGKTSSGKTLVVYYSATGSTKAVAQTIASSAGADLFEIIPTDPYTSDDLDWTNNNSRVSVEHNDESKRDVPLTQTTPDNWSDYDTVFIGYPIWWGIAAWPVDNFVKDNDFTGKTVSRDFLL